ncbi:ABC transporter ATP-binding protein [Tunicatimonas pelagia]|uniref:ABC transporter ATP-binding protein n=1 Tax=Tunicatimonas pelagia TaxID=931531 RepID=UPI0026663C66|nr:ATP-binding cassette domain-containing protein [Tunicatimonas pelagia]WKN42380.1 ATP-binding cassette domain-containing protein [Tunicatimonas pelagia]
MYLLEAQHISKRYANHEALKDVNITIPVQSIFGLLGPNGAGKTTLIRIINQIIEADEGQIRIKEEVLQPKHIADIGYLPEERGLYKKMKVGEQLIYLAQLKGLSRSEAVRRIKDWFQRLEISGWSEKKIEDLSKGMQQKIQFIATVVHEPDLIILDEPFTGFDPVNANLIKDEILKLQERGKTIIFSTHRMESVEELCTHIALINKSEKVLDGKKQDIKNQFRSNTYEVLHLGNLNGLHPDYQLLQQEDEENDYTKSTVRIPETVSPNELLRELIPHVEVHAFQEKIPTINEIFIAAVQ